jgi:hypothetical protein
MIHFTAISNSSLDTGSFFGLNDWSLLAGFEFLLLKTAQTMRASVSLMLEKIKCSTVKRNPESACHNISIAFGHMINGSLHFW